MTKIYPSWYFTSTSTSDPFSTITYRAPSEALFTIIFDDKNMIRSETPCRHKEDTEQDRKIENPSEGLNDFLGFGGDNIK